ncbi:MAG TPA: basic amino acid ABC transporter substrate-binding protein [Firmicutes bacterium]|nr:basic amino acid ABC transporter substrate-binding protein [Bacillota bacterium]
MKNKMNKFIKGIALGAAASLMALSFAACSDSGAASLNLVSEGKLTMGTNAQFPPFEYYEGSEIVGVDAAIMEAIAEKLGLELEIKDMEFESLSAALSGGNIDVIAAGFTADPDREETMDFTDSYFTAKQTILVRADSDYQTKEDLEDKIIGGQTSTTGLTSCAPELTADENIKGYTNGALAVEDLLNGNLDAVIIDNNPANAYKDQHGDELRLIEDQFPEEQYVLAVNKGNTALLEAVNGALKELQDDGKFDEIVAQYIK